MVPDFYSLQWHTALIVVSSTLFFLVSIVGSYLILFKTPDAIKGYKFLFLYLNSAYQLCIFFIGFFGRISTYVLPPWVVCLEFSGLIQLFNPRMIYVELASIFFGLFGVVNAIAITVLYRYCHICHPKSFYVVDARWRAVIHGTISILPGSIMVLLLLLSRTVYGEDPKDISGNHLVIVFKFSPLAATFVIATGSYFYVVTSFSYILLFRIVRSFRNNITKASNRTREMQRALIITLLVSLCLPSILGGVPLVAAVYTIVVKADALEIIHRLCLLSSIWVGLVNISTTIIVVKPYREALLFCFRVKKKEDPKLFTNIKKK
uniref:G protein-coupled receptor n=1 Tax=Steinernema glaseri TaxID=37863 RepID=A0A1I7ZE40_9BILA